MANDVAAPTSAPSLPATLLFQKAHARMLSLARIDEQLATLMDQRRKLQEELRAVQAQINEEFDRTMKLSEEAPAKLLARIADTAKSEKPEGEFNGRLAASLQ